MTHSAPVALAEFQRQFATHLRAPLTDTRPKGQAERASRIYEALLFNNVRGFTDQCFPVARAMLGADAWTELNRAFFRDWSCQTPFFARIPAEFVEYLASPQAPSAAPPWLAELTHYEWLELAASTHAGAVREVTATEFDDHTTLTANPTLHVATYAWPVHRFRATHEHSVPPPAPTSLAVYRTSTHEVGFVEISALTAALLELIQETPATLPVTITTLTRLLPGSDETQLSVAATPLIRDFLQKEILWASSARVGC